MIMWEQCQSELGIVGILLSLVGKKDIVNDSARVRGTIRVVPDYMSNFPFFFIIGTLFDI